MGKRHEGQEPTIVVLERALRKYDRSPFIEMLAHVMLHGRSTPEALQRFADQYPDRMANAIRNIAGLAGYTTDRSEVSVSLRLDDMSDSQLEARLDGLLLELKVNSEPTKMAAATMAAFPTEATAGAAAATASVLPCSPVFPAIAGSPPTDIEPDDDPDDDMNTTDG